MPDGFILNFLILNVFVLMIFINLYEVCCKIVQIVHKVFLLTIFCGPLAIAFVPMAGILINS